MNIAKIIGNNIKNARKLKGLTQTQVANIFHMTQQQYSRFENGVFELNYKQIIDICKLLDISPNELFNFD
jgi:transcriptional regulator with XRE-family HTH domain